jgi:hypothetical protein
MTTRSSAPGSSRRALLVAALVLFSPISGVLHSAAADPTAPTTDNVVELPKLTITDERDLPPRESWRYTAVPGFEILSNASDSSTKHFAREFYQLQEAIKIVWPAVLNVNSATAPTTLLLCEKGKIFDELAASTHEQYSGNVNSMFLRTPEHTILVINFGETLNPTDFEAQTEIEDTGYSSKKPPVEYNPVREAYRQYFRALLRKASARPVPPWLEEGLVQMLASMNFSSDHLVFGRVGERSDDFNFQLNETRFIPLEKMFASELPAEAKEDASLWGAQCHAFVHWGLYGMKSKNRAAFTKFAALACQKPVTPELFHECFGNSYKQMQTNLRSYVRSTTHGYFEKDADKNAQVLPKPPEVSVREATQAEIGRLKGEAFAIVGNEEAAKREFTAPYFRKEHDAALLAVLGLQEYRLGNTPRAKKFLEAAAQQQAVRPTAYITLARIQYSEALAQPGADKGLTMQQVASVLRPLFTARSQPPALPETYELIADTWAHSATSPKADHLAVLDEGIRTFPRNSRLICQTGELYARIGDLPTALVLADLGLKLPNSDANVRARLEQLKQRATPKT